jgi:pyrroline-5-carboxylate reductase
MPSVAALTGTQTLVLSVMAGKTLAFLEAALPGAAIVRAMPNTPAAIGRGMTVLVPNAKVTSAQRAIATDLISATGKVEWIDDETLMDAVTAVSGSGPAYIFLLAEALASAGIAAGLPKELAEKLARETVAGSGELLYRSPLDPATLRKNVTSPGGTTAAALEILMGPGGFDALLKQAVDAASKRSKDLAG